MKKLSFLLVLVMVLSLFSGCRRNVPQDDENGNITGNPSSSDTNNPDGFGGMQDDPLDMAKTQSCQYLTDLWEAFPEEQRFAAYGGTVESATDNAPGELDMQNTEELTTKYLLPETQLSNVSEAASLVHMMNSNIFTAAVVKLTQAEAMTPLYEAWRDTIQSNRWICGQPDKLLMAKLDSNHLLMVFGSAEIMEKFAGLLTTTVTGAEVLYHQAVVS